MEGWIVGENGLILHTNDSGTTWEVEISGVETNLYHVAYIKGFGLFVLGENGTILKRKIDSQS